MMRVYNTALLRGLGLLRKPREPVDCFGYLILQYEPRYHLAECGTMFESMSRSAADNPDIRIHGMAIDDEVVIGRIFVLANSCFQQRRTFHPGETVGNIVAGFGQPILADQALS